MSNKNKSLYFYGFFANVKQAFGKILILMGFIFGLYVAFISRSLMIGFIVFVIVACFGTYIILNAKAQRFDYQRQSGYIMHQGDNNGW